MTAAAHEARASRLLLWYPGSWRARYGAEFSELLRDDLAERPRSWRRAADVARAGLRARLAAAGLARYPADPAAAVRAGLATLAWSAAAFLAIGTAMWSQLAIGLQWAVPDHRGVTQAMGLMSAGLLATAVATALAAVPVLVAAVSAAAGGRGRPLLRPAALVIAGALVLFIGGRHFGNGWPGTGGHLLAAQSPVPGGVAAFGWATTMWVSAYWAHPVALAAFPAGQLAWMAASPLATGALCTGAAQLRRRAGRSPRVLRYVRKASWLAAGGLGAFLAGVVCWICSTPAQRPLFQAGLIDRAGLAVLAGAALLTAAAARRVPPGGLLLAGAAGAGADGTGAAGTGTAGTGTDGTGAAGTGTGGTGADGSGAAGTGTGGTGTDGTGAAGTGTGGQPRGDGGADGSLGR